MNKKDFMDWLRGIIIAVLIISLIVGVIVGLVRVFDMSSERRCEELGDQIGYNTKRISDSCLIEIRPNIWVAEYNIASVLPLIDCEKGKE